MRYPPLSVPVRGSAPAGSAGPPPLIAAAHGSSDPRAAASVSALLDLVRQRAETAGFPGLDVRAAYLGHAAPSLAQALAAADESDGEAVVLPLLLTAAYHSKADIPGVLREAGTAHPRLAVSYGRPLGPHPLLLRALERRLGEIPGGGGFDPGETAVVLAAAGSSDSAAAGVISGLAARWRARRGWRAVLPAYASAAAPSPADAVASARAAGARQVLVATYLLSPGVFADQVRRDCLAAGAAGVSPVLGAAPEIADVVLGRYAETLADGNAAAAG
ncbi:MAG TPA: CbiX/SirB N-terminal domain-containing protein [Streptosporangiaceae bacterium]|jgi:sirohydrochlorin ferrochelatase